MREETIRLAAYCRVSTKKEAQLDSLAHQKEFFGQYAAREGMRLVGVYADEGVSGRQLRRREQFLHMLEDAQAGKFDLVAVKDISRFARNTVDCLQAIRALKKLGIPVRFLSSGQQSMGESEFILTVYASLAQEESANLSRRVKFGKELNAKKGRVPPQLFGYDRVDLFTLRINDAEARAVRMIFARYLDGWGTARIADELNRLGCPTKRGKLWSSRGVRRCLCNPIYCGTLVNHKSTVTDYLEGTVTSLPPSDQYVHERPDWAIVPRAQFDAAQRERARRRAVCRDARRLCAPKPKLPLSGLVFCETCGGAFSRRVRGVRKYWMCYHHDRGCGCTNAVSVPENLLLRMLSDCLTDIDPSGAAMVPQMNHGQLSRLVRRIEVDEGGTVHIRWRNAAACSDTCGTDRDP